MQPNLLSFLGSLFWIVVIAAYIAIQIKRYINQQLDARATPSEEQPKPKPKREPMPKPEPLDVRQPRAKRKMKEDDSTTIDAINEMNVILQDMILSQEFDLIDRLAEHIADFAEIADAPTVKKYLRTIK